MRESAPAVPDRAVTRPVGSLATVVAGVLALSAATLPDAAVSGMVSRLLHRAIAPHALAEWHRLQHAAFVTGAAVAVLGVAGFTRWRRLEPMLDRAGRVLRRPERGWLFDLCAVLVTLGAIHGASLFYAELRTDDYQFLREAHLPLSQVILRTWEGHVFPLWRVESALLYRLWGPHPWAFRWWLFANVAVLAFVQARLLAASSLSRGSRLVGVIVLCGWTQWAQVTMGYWTLSLSVKVWIWTSIAVLALVGSDRPHALRKAIVLLAALAAVLTDSSGVIVVPALVIAALAAGLRGGRRGRVLLDQSAWPVAVAFLCATVFVLGQWLVRLEPDYGLAALGGGSGVAEGLYLFGFGTMGAVAAPIVTLLLPARTLDTLAPLLSAGLAGLIWLAWHRGSRDERAALGFNVALIACGVAMLVGGRPLANYYFMIGWTHYLAFLYVPFAAAIAVAWQEWRRLGAWRPAQEVQYMAIGCTLFLGAQAGSSALANRLSMQGGQRSEQRAALVRRAMLTMLRDSVFTPLASVVPPGGRVPQMLSASLDARFPRLQPFMPLSFYDDASGLPHGRLRWVVGPYGNGVESDTTDATPVTHMKGEVDPAFRAALRRPSWWRDSYFSPAPLRVTPTMPVACDATRRGADPLAGDADRRHWLLLNIGDGGPDSPPAVVNVAVRTDFRSRARYPLAIDPTVRGCVRLELLNLPELALSDSITLLGLESPAARHVELVGLFPPGKRR